MVKPLDVHCIKRAVFIWYTVNEQDFLLSDTSLLSCVITLNVIDAAKWMKRILQLSAIQVIDSLLVMVIYCKKNCYGTTSLYDYLTRRQMCITPLWPFTILFAFLWAWKRTVDDKTGSWSWKKKNVFFAVLQALRPLFHWQDLKQL